MKERQLPLHNAKEEPTLEAENPPNWSLGAKEPATTLLALEQHMSRNNSYHHFASCLSAFLSEYIHDKSKLSVTQYLWVSQPHYIVY